jgi:non-lysosomal glucosylceramidase
MREQSFFYQNEAGGIPMRHSMQKIAFDGQCGEILGAYREHLCSVDKAWLNKHWPHIREAMEYLITTWDSDEDGVLTGQQHNTLDAELSGSTSWLGTLYLAALSASEKMALLQGHADLADRYRKIRSMGAKRQDSALFNGEYYIQIPEEMKGEDYLTGCHIDQLLGQWWAHQLGLGWLYPAGHVRTTLLSLMKYNFRTDFKDVKTFTTGAPWKGFPRKFVWDDDRGLIMTTWPKGGRPEPGKQLRFADEVWSGLEYSAAATMIANGLAAEGWGVFRQLRNANMQSEFINVWYGKVRVSSLTFGVTARDKPTMVTVVHNQRAIPSRYNVTGDEVTVTLKEPVLVEPGESLAIRIKRRE